MRGHDILAPGDLLEGPFGRDLTRDHHCDARADAADDVHLMTNDQEGRASLPNTRAPGSWRTSPCAAIRCGARPVNAAPWRVTSPLSARSMPVMMLTKVVMPAPFGPISPRISPAASVIATASFAVGPP